MLTYGMTIEIPIETLGDLIEFVEKRSEFLENMPDKHPVSLKNNHIVIYGASSVR